MIESLESRTFLTAVLDAETGTLTVTGTAGNDRIDVRPDFRLENQRIILEYKVTVNSEEFVFNALDVHRAVIHGLAGNDVIGHPDTTGMKRVIVASDTGGSVATTQGSVVRGRVVGGRVVPSPIVPSQMNIRPVGILPTRVLGGDGNDMIFTGTGDDVVRGGAGDDNIFSGYGDDVVYGNAGRDRIYGSDGDDSIFGGDGDDVLHGQRGSDLISGGEGNDSAFSTYEPDETDEADTVSGGLGMDSVTRDHLDRVGGFEVTNGVRRGVIVREMTAAELGRFKIRFGR